jgi:hypothetical protein
MTMTDAPLVVVRARLDHAEVSGPRLVNLTFSDGTSFSIYPDVPPRVFADDLLDNFLAAGGVIE